MTSENRFSSAFGRHAYVGETIATHIDGFDIEARLEFDYDSKPQECGFDPNHPDYGEKNMAS